MKVNVQAKTGLAALLIGGGVATGLLIAGNSGSKPVTPVTVQQVADVASPTDAVAASPVESAVTSTVVQKPAAVAPQEVVPVNTPTDPPAPAVAPTTDPVPTDAPKPEPTKVTDPATMGPNGGPLPSMQPYVPPSTQKDVPASPTTSPIAGSS